MPTARKSTAASVGRPSELGHALAEVALTLTFSPVTEYLSPRRCVDVLTRSQFELGRLAKTLLRDAQYEQRRRAKVKTTAKAKVKK
jgi:predicted rRNA methylase YqxC with S4 and FtsJ domains